MNRYKIILNLILLSIKRHSSPLFLFSAIILLSSLNNEAVGQACDPDVPTFNADLTGNADSVWISPSERRKGVCCGANGGPPDNERCIEFWITLDPATEGLNFEIASGAEPTGAMFYQLSFFPDYTVCGTPQVVGNPICLPDVSNPIRITFCKPGNSPNTYKITSIAKPSVDALVIVSDGCTSTITSAGYQPATITWKSISPGFEGEWNSRLSCTSGCASTVATYSAGAPASVTYEVCGIPLGGCSGDEICLESTVNFVTTLGVNITPINPTICFGGASTPLTANPTGGAPPYIYSWNTGANTQVINASSPGVYSVTITDNTSCPPASANVTVTAYSMPILANAGPDLESCANNPNVVLNGSVQSATGGTWSGGTGVFSSPNSLTTTYFPAPGEIPGTVTLTLTTTGNGSCPAESDQMVLTIVPTPIVDANIDQTVCGNNPTTTLAGSVLNAGGGRWSGGTGTFFPNDSTLNALYTPSAAEITATTVTLTLTSIQNGTCTPVADQMVITIDPAPTANANVDQTVCANNSVVTLAGIVTNATGQTWSGGAGIFSNPNALNSTYTPTAAEISAGTVTLTLTATRATCNPVSDQMIITITPAPTVNAGPDRTVCGNNGAVILNGIVTVAPGGTWSGGSGAGSFSDVNALNATYTPTSADTLAGSVTLTLTSNAIGNCIAVVDQMVITYTDAPTANAGPDQTVCGNNANVTLAGSVIIATGGTWSSPGGGTFGNPNALNSTYTPSAAEIGAGSATLTLTTTGNDLCNPSTDQMVITIEPAPTANANADQTVCGNNAVVTLAGIVTNATGQTWSGGAGMFSNPNALNSTYTPTAAEITAGTVTLTLTATRLSCNPVADQMTITITPAPTVNAGPDQIVCANNSTVTLAGSVTIATGGTWSGGGGVFSDINALNSTYTPSATEITNGTATLTLTTTGNGTCNPVLDQMTITITPAPTANAGADRLVCSNNACNVVLAGSVTIAGGGVWSDGGGTFNPNANTLNATYCLSAFETTLPVISLVLTTTGNGTCIPVTDTMQIVIIQAPTVNANVDQTVCGNNSVVTLNGIAGNAPTSTLWSGGTGVFGNASTLGSTYTPSLAEISAGTVTLTLTANKAGPGGCIAVTDQMTITITPAPTVNAGLDRTVCGNNAAVALNGSVTVATGGTWSGGSGTYSTDADDLNATYTPSPAEIAAGTVTLTLTTTGNGTCIAVTDQMTITITPAPTADAGLDRTVCANTATLTLNGAVTVATGGTWSGGTGTFNPNNDILNPSYTPSAAEILAGTATLIIETTGNGNCLPVTDQMTITITPAPTVDAGPDQAICANNAIATLNGSVTVAGGGLWTGGDGVFNLNNTTLNATYAPTPAEITATTVTLTLTTTNNGTCNPVSDQVTITITPAPTVNAGPDQSACASAGSIPLNGAVTVAGGGNWTTNGTGSFNPSSTTLNASYIPSAADLISGVTLTLTTTLNGNCTPVTDNMTIAFTAAPSVGAGPNTSVCTNDFPVQLNGSGSPGTWSGGGGTFNPDNTALNAAYTPSAAEITAQTVTLSRCTNAVGACASICDDVTITLPPGPIVVAGADQTICGDVASVNLNGSVANAGGGLWTTNGSGTFGNASNPVTTYSPSAADITAGGVTLTLTSTINGACSAEADQMILTITPAPTVNAGPDQTVCGDIALVSLNGSVTVATGGQWTVSGGVFADINNPITTYNPSVAERGIGSVTLTLTSTGNGTCNPVSDDITITITPGPTADAGPDQTICADLASTPLNGTIGAASTGGIWSTNGSGIFSANNTTLNASYFPSTGDTTVGTVTLRLTTTGNGTCNPVFDEMIITIDPQPVVNAGPNQTVCADIVTVSLSGGVVNAGGGSWSTAGTGVFVPTNTTLPGSYTPSAADKTGGVVTLTLESTGNGLCNAVSDQVILNFTPAPTINAGPDLTICADAANISLAATTVTVATGGTWTRDGTGIFSDPNILHPTYDPSDADTLDGSIILTVTSTGNGTCTPVSDDLILTITPVPISQAGPDQTVCGDVANISLNGAVLHATGGVWSGGAGTFSPNANTLNATYNPTAAERLGSTVTLTLTTTGMGTCNPVTDDVVITITPPPTINAGPDQILCADIAAVNLNATMTVATAGIWTTFGTGIFADDINPITTYTPSATDISNGIVVLTFTSTAQGTCNPVSDNITINITPAPTVDAGPDMTICADQSSLVLNGSVTTATGGAWTSTGSGIFTPDANTLNANYFPSTTDTANGTVTLTLSTTGNGTCNPVTDDMIITITPAPVVFAGADQTVCADLNSIPLPGAFVANAGGGSWTGNGSGSFIPNSFTVGATYIPSALDKAAGNVTLILESTGNGTCNAVTDQLLIIITPAPTVNAGPDQTVCATTGGVVLNGSVNIATGGTWSTASGQGTFNPDANDLNATFVPSAGQITAGLATLTLTTTGNGTCNAVTDQMRIFINPAPIVTTGPNQTVCASVTTVNFNGTVTNATGGVWTTTGTGTFNDSSALNTVYTPSAFDKTAGSITLTLTSTGNGPCGAVSRNVSLGFTPIPTVDAGPPTMCATMAGVQLNGSVTVASGGTWTTTGSGIFTASANILNPRYNPSAADQVTGSVTLYLTTTGNGPCAAVRDSIQMGIQANPTANAGTDQIVCADIGTVTLAGSVANATGGTWTSAGGGPFVPDADDLNAGYTLSAVDVINGTVTLTLTTTGNGFCNAGTDQMTIIVTPAPTISAGPDQTLCVDVAEITLNGSVTTATGGTWSGGAGGFDDINTLNAVYTPSAADTMAGFVTLTLTSTGNGTCNAVSDDMTITFTPAPTVTAISDATVCSDVNAIFYTATTTIATGVTWSSTGTGFFDDPSLSTSRYNISAADKISGLVRIIATTTGNGTCNPVRDTVDLNINNITIDAGPETMCQSSGDVPLLEATVTYATGVMWSTNGDGVFGDPTALVTTYTIGPNDISNGFAVLYITSTGNGDCNAVTDSIILNIATAPIANADPNQVICADAETITLTGSALNAGGAEWSTPNGTGVIAPPVLPDTINTFYTMSAADTAAGSVTFVLTTTGNGICTPSTDTMIVTITPAPTIDAGPANVCSNAPPVTLNGSATVATGFQWSTLGDGVFTTPTALTTDFTPGAQDLIDGSVLLTLTTTAQGTCNPVSDSILLIIAPSPTANAGNDTTLCADVVDISGALLNGSVGIPQATGGIWTSTGTGTFDPNDITLNASYIPSEADTTAGSVTLTLTTTGTAPCNPVSDDMLITILPAPVVNAGLNQTVCGDIVNVNLNGAVFNAGGGTWSTPNGTGPFGNVNDLSTTYSPTPDDTAAGTVTIVLSSTGMGICNVVRDTMIITITDAPSVDAGPPLICSDAVSIPLSGTRTVATGVLWTTTGTGIFAPNNISLNTNYIPSADDRTNGSVKLTLVTTGNGTCNPVSDSIFLFLTPGPIANAGGDQGICADAGIINLTGSVTNAGGGAWSTPNGTGIFDDANSLNTFYTMSDADTAARTVTIVLTTTGVFPCNAVTDTLIVTITPAPVAVVNAGNDTSVCADNPDIPLNGTIANAAGGEWTTTGSGTFSPNAFTLNATYFPDAGDVGLGTVTLTLTSTGNGICNPITDDMIVTITPRPTANAGVNDTVCADVAGVPLNGMITIATQAFWITTGTGTFDPNANTLTATYIPSAADISDGEVIVTLETIDNGACSPAFDNKSIIITPAPTVDAGFDQTICGDALTISLNGAVTVATGGTWTGGSNTFSDPNILNPTYTVTPADTAAGAITLRLTTTGMGTCNAVFDEIVLTITDAPTISAGPDQTICADNPSIVLDGSVTVASGVTWTSTGTGFFAPSIVALDPSYFTTDADTAAGTLTFVVTSTGNGTCAAVRDTMIATIDPAPIVNAGPDQVVCADIGNVDLNGIVINAGGGAWTSSGSGAFADDSLLITTYVPSDADTSAGIVILNLTSTGNGFCNPVTDNMRIDITPAPTVNAGPDQTICADAASINLNGSVTVASGGVWTSTGSGTFADDSSLSTTYIPSAADTVAGTVTFTLTTTGNGTCNPVSDDLVLTISPKPTVSAGIDRNICADAASVTIAGAFVTVASGGIWTSATGTGIFTPDNTTINVTYVPSDADKAAGIIGLTLTTTGNGTCNAYSDGMILRITPAPTVNAGSGQTVCADITTVQLAGSRTVAATSTWTTSGTGVFSNASILNPTYTPSVADRDAGVVNLTLTTGPAGTCNIYSDQMQIVITPAPTVNAGPDQTVCADIGTIMLNASATVAANGSWSTTNGTGEFNPDPDNLNRTYTLSPADTTNGTVTFVITTTGNGTCNAVRDTMITTITPAPVVSTGGGSICSDVTGVDLNGSVANATGGLWSTSGSGNFTPNFATLNARYNPSAADVAAGFAVLTLTSDGNGTCNPVSVDMNIIITPLPVANAGADQRICRGASTFLIAQIDADVTYAWFTTAGVNISGSAIANITANTDTSFVLTATDTKGCSVNDTVLVIVVDPPVFNLEDTYCFAFGLPLDAAPSFMPVDGTFQWYRNDTLLLGENNTTIIVNESATFMIGYNFGSCSVFDTTDVTPLPVLNGLDKFTCFGNTTIINTSDIAGASYSWSKNGIAFVDDNDSVTVAANAIPPDSIDTYIVTVTDILGCVNNDTILVTSVPLPNITLTNVPACEGDTITLNAQPLNINDPNSRYAWGMDGTLLTDTTARIRVNISGSYSVIYSLGECMAFDTSLVTFFQNPVSSNNIEEVYCDESDQFVVLDAGPGTSYQWLPPLSSTDKTVIVDDPGLYYVIITNEFNCSVLDSIVARDACPPRLFPANAFMPGGSNPGNAYFFIKGAYFKNFSITIFNRWGEIIFHVENINSIQELEDPANNWDGTYRGELMPPGVYPYTIHYESEHNEFKKDETFQGSVTIIR